MGLGSGLGLGLGFRTVALAAPRTAYCCSALRRTHRTHRTRRARRTRSAEQLRHTGQRGAQCRRGRRCGSSASMLCSRVSSRPSRSTTSSVAVRERSCTAHDTAPSISDTEPVSRDTPPSPLQGCYSSCSLPHRPGGARHQPHNILLLFAAQVTEGGGLSSTVSSVSRSGTVGASGAVSV